MEGFAGLFGEGTDLLFGEDNAQFVAGFIEFFLTPSDDAEVKMRLRKVGREGGSGMELSAGGVEVPGVEINEAMGVGGHPIWFGGWRGCEETARLGD